MAAGPDRPHDANELLMQLEVEVVNGPSPRDNIVQFAAPVAGPATAPAATPADDGHSTRGRRRRFSAVSSGGGGGDDDAGPQTKHKEILVAIAREHELWHDPAGDAFATVRVGDHAEHHAVRHRGFRLWWTKEFFQRTRCAPGGQTMADATATVEALAVHEGPEWQSFLRTGWSADRTRVYVDLGDPTWRCVEIDGDDWRILPSSPVPLLRRQGMLPLPVPQRDGSLDELKTLLNLRAEDFRLALAWLVGCLRPGGPYPGAPRKAALPRP